MEGSHAGEGACRSNPSKAVALDSGRVGSSDVPNLPSALTMLSMESVTSAFRIMQFDKSLGVHVWELIAIRRSA